MKLHTINSIYPLWPIRFTRAKFMSTPRSRELFSQATGKPSSGLTEVWGRLHWIEAGVTADGRWQYQTVLHLGRLRVIFGGERLESVK